MLTKCTLFTGVCLVVCAGASWAVPSPSIYQPRIQLEIPKVPPQSASRILHPAFASISVDPAFVSVSQPHMDSVHSVRYIGMVSGLSFSEIPPTLINYHFNCSRRVLKPPPAEQVSDLICLICSTLPIGLVCPLGLDLVRTSCCLRRSNPLADTRATLGGVTQ